MIGILSILSFRSMLVFGSTAFSLIVVMLSLNIVTVDEVALILKMSPEASDAFRMVVGRIQEVTGNILDVISQLLNKLLGWAGVEFDLNKIKVDVHQTQRNPIPINNPGVPASEAVPQE